MAPSVVPKCGVTEANVLGCHPNKESPSMVAGANGNHGGIVQEHVEGVLHAFKYLQLD